MRYITSKRFDKNFSKLSKQVKSQATKQFEVFTQDPMSPTLNNHRLHGKWARHRSINVTGNIRAIYIFENGVTRFIDIGSHSKLYK